MYVKERHVYEFMIQVMAIYLLTCVDIVFLFHMEL